MPSVKSAPVHRAGSLPWAAAQLKCSRPSARKLLQEGLLRGYRIGAHWKFTDEHIAAARQRLEQLAMGALR